MCVMVHDNCGISREQGKKKKHSCSSASCSNTGSVTEPYTVTNYFSALPQRLFNSIVNSFSYFLAITGADLNCRIVLKLLASD